VIHEGPKEIEKLLTIKQVCELDGCGPTTVYDRLIKGEYQAFKDGSKKTLITSSSVAWKDNPSNG
jgi:predicted DNA-binding transcriptional regulator AlpA